MFFANKRILNRLLIKIRLCRNGAVPLFVPILSADTSLESVTESGFASNIFSVYSLMLVLFVVILAVLSVFIIHKRRVKHLNGVKFLYSNISKLLRTPVSNLVSQLRSIITSDEFSDQQKSLFIYMLGNASRLLRLSDIISDVGSHHNNMITEKTDLVPFVSDICNGFGLVANLQGISFKFNSSVPSYNSYIDREKIDTALYIILSEFVSYITKGKSVDVLIDSVDNNLLIKL